MPKMRFGKSIMTTCLSTFLTCGVAFPQRTGDGTPPAAGYPEFPTALAASPLAILISSSPQCGSDNGQAVPIVPPTGIPFAQLNQALANLIFVEPTWSLSDVKRALRMMGATNHPSAQQLLELIINQAPTIVARRSAALSRTVTRAEIPTFQAWLQSQAADLRRVAREQLPQGR